MRVKNTARRGPALARQAGVGALPLERRRIQDAPQSPVIHRADADAAGLGVVGHTIDVAVRMAGMAGELAMEGILAMLKSRSPQRALVISAGSAQIDPRRRFAALPRSMTPTESSSELAT